jgi:hypothetical protein
VSWSTHTEAEVKKLKNALQLTPSMAAMTKEHEDEAVPKKWFAVQISYRGMAPVAVSKLEKKQGNSTGEAN